MKRAEAVGRLLPWAIRPAYTRYPGSQEAVIAGRSERQSPDADGMAVHLAGHALAGVLINVLDNRIFTAMAGPTRLRLGTATLAVREPLT